MLPDENYLFAESAILQRLKDNIDESEAFIGSLSKADDLLISKHAFPGIFVLYYGDEVSITSAGRGVASQANQHWIIFSAAKCSENMETGQKAREIVGKLIYKALTLLQGYEVAPGMTLVRTSTMFPILYEQGYVFVATEFILTVNVVGV